MNSLAYLLSSSIRAEISRLLFSSDQEEVYLRELSRRTGHAFSAVQRELGRLHEQGLVLKRVDGNRTYFKANKSHPFFPELCGLVRKSSGMPEFLQHALTGLGIKAAFVFGSIAAGTEKVGSDVDLMIIGDVSLKDITSKLSRVSESIGREINPYVVGPSEYTKRLRSKDHFLTTVSKGPKLHIIGGENELTGLAK